MGAGVPQFARLVNWPKLARVAAVLAAGGVLLAGAARLSWAGKEEQRVGAPPGAMPESLSRCRLLASYAETDAVCRRLWAEDRARFLGLPAPGRPQSAPEGLRPALGRPR